ncbi:type II toxin-antitoxin system PemI/MazE family antitoxin [Lentilactobacillus kisonensis]|uniref:Toxin-antitoxin system, antitoxin component, AbrB domain protein n=2 Tax=Lentilactobacillus kisonensis TaxID=481722 RepID=H1LFT9_9LACO|nr:AbrB family transcriptional regulator [Lentilactobacillus kisonensis]EHO51531.1 toxin-antitoxin system, antitoxin component, AbrB domain protein [Lentilactobacillus kisonensis F0435]KRL22897.1 hypothetical protein FC98_GL001649 [Lentilactobacillus kisonensis DSM 19906 = JCM 15041]
MKIQKQGNTLIVTVPKKFEIKPGTEVIAIKGNGNSFSYIPKTQNPFTDSTMIFERYAETFNDSTTRHEEI